MRKICYLLLTILLLLFVCTSCTQEMLQEALNEEPGAFRIGSYTFETLQDAVNSLKGNKALAEYTITLDRDVSDSGAVISGITGALKLDFGNHKYILSNSSYGIIINNRTSTVEISGGTLALGENNNFTAIITVNSDISIIGTKLDVSSASKEGIDISQGSLSIDGETFIQAVDGSKAINASNLAVVVISSEKSIISGDIAVSDDAVINVDKGNISGGILLSGNALVDIDEADVTITNITIEEGSNPSIIKTDNTIIKTEGTEAGKLQDIINSYIHEHTFDDAFSYDETYHWHVATCGHDVVSDKAEHVWDDGVVTVEATEDSDGVKTFTCEICGYKRTESISVETHEHTFAEQWSSDGTYHWHAATCGHDVVSDKAEHVWDDGVVTVEATEDSNGVKTFTCEICGYKRTESISVETHEHTFAEQWSSDGTYHWRAATCGHDVVSDKAEHVYDSEGVCSICGYRNIFSISYKGALSVNSRDVSGDIVIPSVVNGRKVKSIASSGFYNCENITSVTIPDSVTTIGDGAFYRCTGLEKIVIPNSVTVIGDGAFEECDNIKAVYVADLSSWCGITFKDTSSSPLISNDETKLYIGGKLLSGELEIPSGVTNIPTCAFFNCTELTDITLPETVTNIEMGAFYCCTGITSISLPDSLLSIRAYAFYGCNGLTKVTIPDSVTTIEEDAFSEDTIITMSEDNKHIKIIDGVLYDNDLTRVSYVYEDKIPSDLELLDSVTTIGDSAFSGCSGLTSITIPDSVTSIGEAAFYRCSGLTSITIPDSVTSIGYYAFYYCDNLKSVTIGAGLESFEGLSPSNLETITISKENKHIGFADGILYDKDLTNISYVYKDKIPSDLVLLDSVTSIGEYTFSGCSDLSSVTIGDSVTSIGYSAFNGCSGLTSITIPDSVTSIGNSAFYNCSGLTNVVIGESVTTIGDSAFYGCNGLTSITIPDSVTSIGYSIFYGCDNLKSVEIGAGLGSFDGLSPSNWETVTISKENKHIGFADGILYDNDLTRIACVYKDKIPSDLVLVDTLTSIGNSAFSECSGLTSIIIPDSVISIGNSAFNGCSGLTSITIPDSVTSIDNYAFYGCSGLTSVTIPDSVTSIGNYAFYGCSGLTSITIGAGLESFNGLYPSTWETITISKENKHMGFADGILYDNDLTSISYVYKDRLPSNLVLLDSVTSIDNYAFSGCSGLTSITIPDSVTSIGDSAFNGCSGLTSITIPDSVTSIGDSAFNGCSGLTSITIPDSVTSIGDSAFNGCDNLKSIEIGAGLESFNGLYPSTWETITISKENKHIGFADGILYDNDLTSISYVYKDRLPSDLVLVDTLTSIGNYSFSECNGLTSIIIPDSVISIGDYAFYKCTGLSGVTIGDAVTSIGDYGFYGCSGLTSITIPDSVTNIGSVAFYSCNNLKTVAIGAGLISVEGMNPSNWENFTISEENKHIGFVDGILYDNDLTRIACAYKDRLPSDLVLVDTLTSISRSAFYKCSGLTSITIGDSVTSIGDYAFYGCNDLKKVIIGDSVTSIGGYAFFECTKLSSVTFGDAVASIGGESFHGCTSLRSITMPDSVTFIGISAFYYCTSLEVVVLPESLKTIGSSAFGRDTELTGINFKGSCYQWNLVEKNTSWNYDIPCKQVVCKDGIMML